MRLVKAGLLSTALVAGLAACGDIIDPPPPLGAPTISSFVATPSSVQSGGSTELSWQVSGATSLSIDQDVGDVTGQSSVTVENITTTTSYTLTATNANGDTSATTTVTVTDDTGPIIDPPDGDLPTGTFGVSASPEGPFENDMGDNIGDPSDDRIVTVSPGDTFYAQVQYQSTTGMTGAVINLVNSSPEGISGPLDPDQSGFTLVGEPTGDCDFASQPTSVTCVYEISVDDGVVNIDQLDGSGNEFAYVFRTQVSNAAGTSNEAIRGYVIVE